MTVALDLTRRHITFRRGPLLAIGSWTNVDGRWRPCLVLLRAGEEYADTTVPCIISVDKAWIWSEDIGDPQIAARTAFEFAEALRLGTEPKSIFFIATLVHDLLGDLLTIPPAPPMALDILAEVTVTNRATGKSHEVALTDV